MKKIVSFIINLFFSLFPVNKNKIVFQSGRNKIDSNPYAIYKYIKGQKEYNYKCIWLIEKNTDTSLVDKKDCFYYKSLVGLFHLATAKYWIRSQSIGSIVKKRKNQIYVQTWHGAGALKKCEYDCTNIPFDKRTPMEHTLDWDYLVTTDKKNDVVMRNCLGYTKETLLLGNAVTDLLINSDMNLDNLYKMYNITPNKKIILYAPTFRDYELECDSNIGSSLLNRLKLPSDDYVLLLRLHPLVCNKISNMKLPKNFINVGDYPIIEHLMLISDVLITDYSSIVFEYALLNRPIIFYPYDYDKYVEERGGFYIDYNTLPGSICHNSEDIKEALKDINSYNLKYKNNIKSFNKEFNYLNDGHVCERFVEVLKKI